MNNHNIYRETENSIEYRTLKYVTDNEKDNKYILSFIQNYDYTKVIELNYTMFVQVNPINNSYNYAVPVNRIIYFKDGKKHNIYGPAEIHTTDKNVHITWCEEFYFLNDKVLTKEKWFAKTRKYKLKKILTKFGE